MSNNKSLNPGGPQNKHKAFSVLANFLDTISSVILLIVTSSDDTPLDAKYVISNLLLMLASLSKRGLSIISSTDLLEYIK